MIIRYLKDKVWTEVGGWNHFTASTFTGRRVIPFLSIWWPKNCSWSTPKYALFFFFAFICMLWFANLFRTLCYTRNIIWIQNLVLDCDLTWKGHPSNLYYLGHPSNLKYFSRFSSFSWDPLFKDCMFQFLCTCYRHHTERYAYMYSDLMENLIPSPTVPSGTQLW